MNKIPIALLAIQYQLIIISIIIQIQPIHSELSYKVDNCAQLWLKYGINQSGNYTFIFDDNDNSKANNLTNGIIVECDMSSLNLKNEINDDDVPLNVNEQYFEITTIIHHDSEESRLVQGYESPGSFEKNIIYSNGHLNDGHESSNEMIIKHIEKVIDSSYSCQQYIRWDCKGSVFSFWFHHYHNWWSDRNGQTRTYWGGAEPDSNSCGCFPYCYPTAKNSTCNCDANIKTDWIEDSGLLLHKDRLPVTQLRFGDTGESYEVGRYTLGPLICRSFGHRNISFGHFTAPITLTSPGYPRRYPPPFRRHEWFVMTAPDNNRSIEMVFLDYDVIHYGAYLSVPGCRYTMEIDIYNKKTTKGHYNQTKFNYLGKDWYLLHSIKRERYMPPYYITNGEETLFHLKFITCNQQQNYHHQNNNKGFKVEFRHSKCSACNLLDKNNNNNNCFIESNNCIHIYSYGYPFPHYLLGKHIDHTPNEYRWRIETVENYILQIEFNDFDVISTPGQHYCDNDLLTIVYDDSKQMNQIKNDYCNINRFNIGKLHSNSNYMEIIFRTSLRKVGNSRGIHATIRSMHRENYEIIAHELKNVAEGRPTDQSSTRATRDSSLAVDHNFEQREASKCSSTNYEREPWWRVNLQKRHRIYGLEIYSYLGKQLEPSPQAVVNILNDRNMDISPDCNREWPAGNYGLPMPASGCPSSKKGTDQWLTGMRFHAVQYDKPFDDKIRYWSENIMLKGGATPTGIEQHFCIHNGHDDPKMNSNENSTETCTWQPGKYCILQYGDSCPDGFHIGSITWFDKSLDDNNKTTNLFNYINGTVPKGDYTTHNTTLYFCCREDGDPTKPIYLPKTRPFYLFQYGRICQEVADMSEMEHFFHYEEEVVLYGPFPDLIFASGQKLKFQDPHPRIEVTLFDRGLTLHYCYYDIADKLKGFQVLVDTTPDTFGYGRWYDGDTGMARPVNKPFLSAVECASYGTTEEEFSRIKLNCTQPIEGQYVIIFMKDRQDALQLCEVVVFGEESCGRPLGMATEEILDSAITASNFDSTKGLVHHPYNVRLNSFAAWCTTNSDPDKHIQIDLRLQNSNIVFDSKLPPGDESNWNQINFVTIVGVAMQGMPHGFKSYYVTQFQLLFSNDSIHWTFEEEPIGRQKIYRCVQCEAQHVDPNEVVMYNLLKPVVARFIRVKIMSFRGGPCMRFELIGCRGDKKNFCSRTLIASTPGVISSPNYPFYYAQYKSCVWNIRPNNSDRHIELDFIVLDLAPAEKTGGKCHDGLYINHSSQQSKIVIEAPSNSIAQSIGRPSHSFLQLNYPKKIISNGPVTLTLKTCFRFSMTRYQGFLVRFRETDCPGCGIGDSRCSRVHNCTSLCGRILSINYPLNYLNNHRCRWLIRAPAGHYFNITIEDFDITGSQPYPTNSSRNRPIKHCLFDHLSFIDPSTGMILGRYCNTNKPSKYIFSNWNELLIEFSSDSSSNGRGFKLKYQAERYNLLPEAKPLLISPLYSCPNGWLYFRGYCYSSFVEKESLQWYEAEEKCAQKAKGRDGHLVSITDYLEMNVVHYWIVEQWKLAPHQSIYIGLIDTNREGFYNWSDGNPMSYTDWYRDNLWPLESTTLFYSQQQQQKNWSTNINESNGQFTANNSPMFSWNGGDLNSFFNQYSQPDGGAYEDCTVINFHSIHSTLNWHDVPCSLGKKVMPTARMINHSSYNYNLSTTTSSINSSTISYNATNSTTISRNKINFNHNDGLIRSYICKMDSNSSLHQHSPRRTLYTRRIGEAKKAEIRSKVDTNRYFVCNNYEVISNLFRCDGTANCRDGSDETEGCSMNDECLESQFQCANGHCIAIGKYCDFIDDCGDGSDEIFCVRRQCKKNSEFKCNNDQCIPNYKRCNLFHDCRDQSDEDNCSGKCNLNTTFQCYYGNCIPLYALCDRHRDCPGKFFEDEHETVCSMLNQNIDQHYYMNHNYQQQQQQSNSFNLFNSYDKSFRWRRGSARNSSSSKTNRNRRQKIESTCQDDNKQIMKTNRKTCQDLLSYHGISKDGYYDLNPMDGNKLSLKVYCRFLNSTHATTIINHDTEDRLYVRSSFDAPGSYARTITYEGSIDLIVAVINASVRCKQFLSYECSGSRFNFDSPKPNSWWVSRMNRKEYSWGTDRLNYCACYPHCISNLRCNCDAGLMFNWTRDYGYIEDKNRLPIRQVAFGEVYHIGQLGYVQVGPVECMGQNVGMKLSKSTGEIESNCPMESSKLFECNSGQIIESKHLCIYEYDQLQYPIGCRDVSHLRNCSSFQCPSDYVKCPNSYCIPYRYICNGKWDCVGGLDEIGCARYTCPGHYKCANESSCIWLHQLCDGFRHCPLGDDEWFCDLNCPRNCICNGHYVDCRNSNLTIETMANISKETRKLDLSGNNLGPDLSFIDLSRFIYIGELILQNNQIEIIHSHKFIQLTNLYKLDLRYNRIRIIEAAAFAGLQQITTLLLDHNHELEEIHSGAFVGLVSLRKLNISNTKLKTIVKNTFLQMSSLQQLTLVNNQIDTIEKGAFNDLISLMSLDIRGNRITNFSKDMFIMLKSLRNLASDSFKFCCMVSNIVPFNRCYPPQDEISDCEDLLSKTVQRLILWILGFSALIGNIFVIVWRFKTLDKSNRISSTLILSLGFADFLMGIYLIMIASVDEYYRGRYIENSDYWKNSIWCHLAGFLSTLSLQTSVLTLVLIAIDRLISISFTFSNYRFTLDFTHKSLIFTWILMFILSIIPLLPIDYFQGKFYSRSGVCLAFHITITKWPGWEYSVAVFLVFNLLAFLFIVCCYIYMYKTIVTTAKKRRQMIKTTKQIRESRIGLQMALIVGTNFLCWFPVIIMGFLALGGVHIPGVAYSWIAVLVLPLNSATNPAIYTILHLIPNFSVQKQRQLDMNNRFQQSIMSLRMNHNGSSTLNNGQSESLGSNMKIFKQTNSRDLAMVLSNQHQQQQQLQRPSLSLQLIQHTNQIPLKLLMKPPPGYQCLSEFLRTKEPLVAKDLYEICLSLSKILKDYHQAGYAFNQLTCDNIFVSIYPFHVNDADTDASNNDNVDRLHAYIPPYYAYQVQRSLPSEINTNNDNIDDGEESNIDDYSMNIEEFGRIIKRMLQIYHSRSLRTNSLLITK